MATPFRDSIVSNPMLSVQLAHVIDSARSSRGDDTNGSINETEGAREGVSLLSRFRTLQGRGVEAVEGKQSLYESRLDSFELRNVSA